MSYDSVLFNICRHFFEKSIAFCGQMVLLNCYDINNINSLYALF